jgi:hypothetical protein
MSATIGELLATADARFEKEGGYKATAYCEAGRVDLIHQDADGKDTVCSSAPLPEGIAPEDVANDLLVAEVGAEFSDRYFVITFKN